MNIVLNDGLPPLREIIATHNLAARKSLGQNFLLDFNLIGKIARAVGNTGEGTVIEVGPGPGGLTRSLLWHGANHVIVIEKDYRAIPILKEIAEKYPGKLEILHKDALDVDIEKLGQKPRRIVANLPYNVATPLLIGWLEKANAFSEMVLMLQKEVVERLIAPPRTKAYGRLSVLAQQAAKTQRLFDVNPRAFVPIPKVTSAIISLKPYNTSPFPCESKNLQRVTEAAFGQRRKMLRQSLRKIWSETELSDLLEELKISPTARAEELSIANFAKLANAVGRRTDIQSRPSRNP